MARTVGSTAVYLGRWGAQQEWDYANLQDDEDGVVDQELIHKLSDQMVMGELVGSGGFGRVFHCTLLALPRNGEYGGDHKLVVKLPKSLLRWRWIRVRRQQLLDFEPPDMPGARPEQVAETEQLILDDIHRARYDFVGEVQNFEQIYEPEYLHTTFGGGKRAVGANLRLMKEQLRRLQLEPGRRFIHRIVHFDPDIPAILSERCDGTLAQLRETRPNLFRSTPELSPTWEKVAYELGSAIEYISSRNMVHVDIKPGNVLFVWEQQQQPMVKLGDFGICVQKTGPVRYDTANWDEIPLGTRRYAPKGWPDRVETDDVKARGVTLDAERLSFAEYAITMVRMLYVPEAPEWPNRKLHAEDEVDYARTHGWGVRLFGHSAMMSGLLSLMCDWREPVEESTLADVLRSPNNARILSRA
jgi:serine/threonine protein kinase